MKEECKNCEDFQYVTDKNRKTSAGVVICKMLKMNYGEFLKKKVGLVEC